MSLQEFFDKFGGFTEPYYFYNGEVELRYDPKAHIYYLMRDGDFIPQDGVTTVVHVIDKSDALIPWGCKMMAQKLLATAPVIETPLGDKLVPQMSYAEFETLVLGAKGAHKEKLEEAATVGQSAHNWIEQYIKSVLAGDESRTLELLAKFPDDVRAQKACEAALDWMAQHNVRWRCTERKIYSRRFAYAGTMDGLAVVDSCANPLCCPHAFKDRLSVIDWKTSNYLYLEYIYQTAAYQWAYMEEMNEAVEDRWIIRLGKDDGEFDPWHRDRDKFTLDFDGFMCCLSLTRSVRNLKEELKAQADLLRADRKAKAKAEREAALKLKCKGADKYKGVRPPQCNKGNPCEACLAKYAQAQRDREQDAIVRMTQKEPDASS